MAKLMGRPLHGCLGAGSELQVISEGRIVTSGTPAQAIGKGARDLCRLSNLAAGRLDLKTLATSTDVGKAIGKRPKVRIKKVIQNDANENAGSVCTSSVCGGPQAK